MTLLQCIADAYATRHSVPCRKMWREHTRELIQAERLYRAWLRAGPSRVKTERKTDCRIAA